MVRSPLIWLAGGLPYRCGRVLRTGRIDTRRDLDAGTASAAAAAFRESIEAGLAHREDALRFAARYARGVDEATLDRFVAMYVNELSVDLGEEGRRAVDELLALVG